MRQRRSKFKRGTKDRNLNIRVSTEQLRRWKRAAENERRPLSQWIVNVLESKLEYGDE